MLIWVGRFYSDIIFSEHLFEGAITIYSFSGEKKCECFSYLSDDSKETVAFLDKGFKEFVLDCMKQLVKQNKKSRFLFYSDILATEIIEENPFWEEYIVAVNRNQHPWLRSKTYSRIWLKDIVKLPGLDIVTKEECTMKELQSRFSDSKQFIIQENISSGGHGTYLLNSSTEESVQEKLDHDLCYVVSPYVEDSKSINTHVFISDNQILVFPYSFQDIIYSNDRLEFYGSVFTPNKEKKEEVHELSYKIAEKLQTIGYRGICGIDLLITEDDLYFVELNCRFQGSTFIIDSFANSRYGVSIFDLVLKGFEGVDFPLSQKEVVELDYELLYSIKNMPDSNYPVIYKESHMHRCLQYR